MKRHTSKSRHHARQSVLEVRVLSPRIVWFGCVRIAAKVTKIAFLLALLGGAGWGVWSVMQKALYQNPDFRLQAISLNANPVIDEVGVTAAADIDLSTNPSLFDIDVQEVVRKLRALPEIADASVERHLPATLAVQVIPRHPKAWILCPAAGHSSVRKAGGLLVDSSGVAYPCPPLQLESAASLPIIELPASSEHPLRAGAVIGQPEVEHCFMLLDSARDADPDAMHWIESVRQVNEWSLLMVTRQGTSATFGLSDHARQMESLRAALDHAGTKGYVIATINLIPKYNIPITLREEPAAPVATVVVDPPRAIPVSVKEIVGGKETRRTRTSGRSRNSN